MAVDLPPTLGVSKELKGAVIGPGKFCLTAWFKSVGIWTRGLIYSCCWFLTSETATSVASRPAHTGGSERDLTVNVQSFVDVLVIIKGCQPTCYTRLLETPRHSC